MPDLRKHSSTSNIVRFTLKHSTTGQGLTGLTEASASMIVGTISDNEATTTRYRASSSEIETISTLGTFAAPTSGKCRFKEVDATNHPGLYEIQIADARFAVASAKRMIISVSGATNLLSADYEIELTQFDPFDSVRLGLTALPNAAAEASGGLVTRGTGTGQISVSSGQVILQTGTGTGQLDFTSGVVKANVTQYGGSNGTFSSGRPEVNTSHIAGSAVSTASAQIGVNVVNAGGTAWGSGAITAASIASDAITAAKIATGAIDADALAADAGGEIADAVWDEATSGHVTSGTFGQALFPIRAGTAAGGANGSITLDGSASAVDDFYKNALVVITGGTGPNQARTISGYTGSTKVATITPNWGTNPSSDSVFVILPAGAIAGASAPTAGEVADAVWDEARSGHVSAGTFGEYVLADMTHISGDSVAADNAESFFDGTGYAGTSNVIPTVTTVTNQVTANCTAISGDTTAADNAESFFDGTGYAGTNNVIPTVTTVNGLAANTITATSIASDAITAAKIADGAIDANTFAASSITATAIATDAITAAKIADGAIDANTFASDAITAAAIAADAIGSSELATTAVTEIVSAVLTTQMTESYRSANAAPTLAQAQFELIAHMGESSIVSTTKTLKKIDGSTTAKTYTLDSASTPTSITETT